MLKEEIETLFGDKALEFGLFYKVDYALRFELGMGGSLIDQFSSAYDRGRKILSRAFRNANRFVFVVTYFNGSPFSSNIKFFRSLKKCGITIYRPYECWTISEQDETSWELNSQGEKNYLLNERTHIAFEGTREQVTYFLWGALACELRIEPSLWGTVHIIAPDVGILAHPYDDRGMDVIGSNWSHLRSLYAEFDDWLLDYDREKMLKTVGSL